ncbi:MAG: hypothetical protein M0015_16535 [Betaproteobacteria bacterium]|nr:hypothetical protein [Betaproteobacteria bacterium]
MRLVASLALALALAGPLCAGVARADPGWRLPPGAELRLYAQARGRMSPEEREQLREQLRSADRSLYRNPGRAEEPRGGRFERPREAPPQRLPPGARMSPQQREQLREDILNAYRRRGRE